MIHSKSVMKAIGSKPINLENVTPKAQAYLDEVKALSETKEWEEALERLNKKYGNISQLGRGRFKV